MRDGVLLFTISFYPHHHLWARSTHMFRWGKWGRRTCADMLNHERENEKENACDEKQDATIKHTYSIASMNVQTRTRSEIVSLVKCARTRAIRNFKESQEAPARECIRSSGAYTCMACCVRASKTIPASTTPMRSRTELKNADSGDAESDARTAQG